ncbi:hypothetical protein JOM56_013302 [Amanita muscaria]
MGRLIQDTSPISLTRYSTVADLIRMKVLGRFIHECITWLKRAEVEEREGMVSEDRYVQGVQNLCRFYTSLVKLLIVDPTSDMDQRKWHTTAYVMHGLKKPTYCIVLSLLRGPLERPLSTYAILLSEAFLRTAQAVLYIFAPVCSTPLLFSWSMQCLSVLGQNVLKRRNVLLYVLTTLIHMSCSVVVS